jgi:hypothetical protein
MLIFKNTVYTQPLRFGRLTVLAPAGKNQAGKELWLCGCLCGNYKKYITADLCRKSKPAKSCDTCYDEPRYTKEYDAYMNAWDRCYRPTNKNYLNYGGRGITMSQQWRSDFLLFLIDVGLAPTSLHSLNRIDNDGNYEKGNVKWSTKSEQMKNTSRAIKYKLGFLLET